MKKNTFKIGDRVRIIKPILIDKRDGRGNCHICGLYWNGDGMDKQIGETIKLTKENFHDDGFDTNIRLVHPVTGWHFCQHCLVLVSVKEMNKRYLEWDKDNEI